MPRRHHLLALASLILGIVIGSGGTAWRLTRRPPPVPQRVALSMPLPDEHALIDAAVSPDGTEVVYSAVADGRSQLVVRSLASVESRALAGTEHAAQPFFSPDGTRVGFFAEGWLKWVSVDGGTPVELVRVNSLTAGASWAPDDRIVFAPLDGGGLRSVPAAAASGEAATSVVTVTTPDRMEGEISHGWPRVLPDGRTIVFTVGREQRDPRLAWVSPDADGHEYLAPADGGAFFVDSGYLVFARRGEAFAMPIDLGTREVTGPMRPIADDVSTSAAGYDRLGRSSLRASANGRLIYVRARSRPTDTRLVWVDRAGRMSDVDEVDAPHEAPRLAPDGSRIAMTVRTAPFRRDLWEHDVASATRRPLTANVGDNHSPVWSPDGTELAFASNRDGPQRIYRMTMTMNTPDGQPTTDMWVPGDARTPGAWAADGDTLLFHELHPERARDILAWVGRAADGQLRMVVGTNANERTPALSGDGRWLAYVSDAVDGDQVYVQPYPEGDARRVSASGGTEPVWARHGSELFFRSGHQLFVVEVGSQGELGPPRPLFDGRLARDPSGNVPSYDVDGDGSRFLMLRPSVSPRSLAVVSGWEPTEP